MRRDTLLSTAERARLAEGLRRACGLALANGLQLTLELAVRKAAQALKVPPKALYDRAVRGDAAAVQMLLEHALVHESYFFRQPRHFEALRARLLSGLDPGQQALLWSAGCAAGEEAYSLAITVALAGTRARILGTDVSGSALVKAKGACYSAWALRGLDPVLRERFFEPGGEPLKLRAEIARSVEWVQHNLVTEVVPVRGCDAIFCRNVLIYFAPEIAREVLRRLVSALRPGGLLMLGRAEVPLAQGLGLTWVEEEELFVRSEAVEPPISRPLARRALAAPSSGARGSSPTDESAGPNGAAAPVTVLPAPALTVPADPAPVQTGPEAGFARARAAARQGLSLEAVRLARESAETERCPEAFLLLAMVAEERGELGAALEAVQRAVALDAGLAMGMATAARLLERLGSSAAAEQARADALEVLERLDPATPLRSVEPITAGALRQALLGAAA